MRPWREAWEAALAGFYGREAPGDHFRTSVHASGLYAAAVATLLRRVDAALGHPDPLDLVDVGAGRGELLAGVATALPAGGPDRGLQHRLRLLAVEIGPLADAPPAAATAVGLADAAPAGATVVGLGDAPPAAVTVVRAVADLPPVTGLLVANEWLDDVPLDVVELTPDGPRLVLVDPAGTESAGGSPGDADAAWLERWWPLAEVGDRAEVGRTRDAAWAGAVGRLRAGVALAVDYGHEAPARPRAGTLTGYRDGRQVPPVPDGTCNLTAHVALDSVLAAGRAAGAGDTRLDDQRSALLSLGVDPRRPPLELARTDPPAYLTALRRAGEAAELTDRAGLGRFRWLLQGVGIKVPWPPAATRARVRRAPAPDRLR